MIIDRSTLGILNTGFNSVFNRGFASAKLLYPTICSVVKSTGPAEAYGWLKDLPDIREWLGDRFVHQLQASGFTIDNRKFEMTVEVQRTDIEDDRIGTYTPLFERMGMRAAQHPDRLLAEVMSADFSRNCYDGQFFFDTDHPVGDGAGVRSVANTDGGTGPAWFLLDLSQPVRPFIYQERAAYALQSMDKDVDGNSFWRDRYVYGVRGRSNVGFGAWQLAWGSKQTLNQANFEAARSAMSAFKDDVGSPLGIVPTHLVVPVALESAGRRILKTQFGPNGESNPWVDSTELVVSRWLS
jgi:phage major head subunit gpT-like protein